LKIKKVEVQLQSYIIINNTKYIVDGKKVVLEPSNKEINMAIWLSKKLSIEIKLLPRILLPENIKTADYSINGEYWDLKEITSNRNNALYNRIRKKDNQASNFIIDISNSKLTIKALQYQIVELYSSKHFKWLNKIIVKKNNDVRIIKRQ